jgi:beta-fructofuranosidase
MKWTVLDDALGPGLPGTWDGLATWTGCVVQNGSGWYMFYTGASRVNDEIVQSVGAAKSSDLTKWSKLPGPLFSADPRWYETREQKDWFEEVWRDPWIFTDEDGLHHALVTARAKSGLPDGRGVVGHATSTDLLAWEVKPPLSSPGEFGHIEVLQLAATNGGYALVFSCDAERVSSERRARLEGEPEDATYLLAVRSPLGPFDLEEARPALPVDMYSGRLVRKHDDSLVWLAFVHRNQAGEFVGELSDPIPYETDWSP